MSKRCSISLHDNNLESHCNSELKSVIMNHEKTYIYHKGLLEREVGLYRSILKPLHIHNYNTIKRNHAPISEMHYEPMIPVSVGIATGYKINIWDLNSGRSKWFFSTLQTIPGVHLTSYKRIPGKPIMRVKQPKSEADYSQPPGKEFPAHTG
jgi:hypothetical protein